MSNKENLNKSIDAMIDDLFAENVEKSLDVASQAQTTADAAIKQAPKAQNDDSRGAGRPKQISDVPENDEDGKRSGEYDGSISQDQKASDQPEASQVKMGGQDKGEQKKDSGPMMKSISEADFAEFAAFKKSQEDKKNQDVLKKAQEEQKTLLKAILKEATSTLTKENEGLKKSLEETQALVKAMAERPQRRKSIDGIQALEKSQRDEEPQQQTFSKSEMLDVAEELVMNKSQTVFRDEHLIELENTGYIYNNEARNALERHIKNKK